MTDWENIELGNICEVVRGGSPRPIIDYITDEPDGVNWLKIGDVKETDKFFTHANEKIKPSGIPKTREVKAGDLILSNSMSFGRAFITLIDGYIHDGWLRLRCDESRLDKEYLYYFLTSNLAQNQFKAIATGSVVNNLKSDTVKAIKIDLPTLVEQKRIAEVLSMFDDKIKCNEEINKNLEEQAQAIFKSWFVDFEPFGGIQPSEMQFIPLQELCKVVTKGTTPTTLGKSFTSTGINFIKAESILDNHSIDSSKFAFIDEETNALLKRSVIKANDIVFTIAGTLGRFAMVDNSVLPANTNQAVAIIRPDETKVTPAYLYSFFIGNWHNEYYSKRIQQAVQANLSLTTIKSLPIAVLKNTTMNNYDKLVSPLFALMKSNEEENRRLSKLRDTLLPRLMSGELDVSNLDL